MSVDKEYNSSGTSNFMCHSASQAFELLIHTKAQRNRTQCVMLSYVVCCLHWCRWETRLAAASRHTMDLMVGFLTTNSLVPFVELFCVSCVKQLLFLYLSIGLNKPKKIIISFLGLCQVCGTVV